MHGIACVSNLYMKKAFTLIELLLVITLISILTGVTLTLFNPVSRRRAAEDGVKKSNIGKIVEVMETYNTAEGSYPPTNAFCDSTGTSILSKTYMGKCPNGQPNGATYSYTSNGTSYGVSVPLSTDSTTCIKYRSGWSKSMTCTDCSSSTDVCDLSACTASTSSGTCGGTLNGVSCPSTQKPVRTTYNGVIGCPADSTTCVTDSTCSVPLCTPQTIPGSCGGTYAGVDCLSTQRIQEIHYTPTGCLPDSATCTNDPNCGASCSTYICTRRNDAACVTHCLSCGFSGGACSRAGAACSCLTPM